KGKVGRLTNGKDDRIRGNIFDVGVVEFRTEAAVRIEDFCTANRTQAGNGAVLAKDLFRPARIVQFETLLLSFHNLDLVSRHLLAAFQADHVNFFVAAQAQGGARDIVRDLFAASHLRNCFAHRGHFGTNSGTGNIVGNIAATDYNDAPTK